MNTFLIKSGSEEIRWKTELDLVVFKEKGIKGPKIQ